MLVGMSDFVHRSIALEPVDNFVFESVTIWSSDRWILGFLNLSISGNFANSRLFF